MKYILMMLLLYSIGASAQTQVDSITVKQKMKLNGYRLTGVSNDTTTANQDSSKAMTEAAVKKLILGRSASRDVQVAQKINYTDSAGMLAAYRAALNTLTANVLLRLKYSDTASMLSAYQSLINLRLKYSDTASLLAAYQSAINTNTSNILLRVKYSDTASMLAAYQTLINQRLKYSDTATLLAAYQSAINTNTSNILLRVKYSDTASMLAAYQTLINQRLKYSDTASLLAAYQSGLLARLKYTDTSGMLAAYQTAINARLKYTDSSGMLLAYRNALNTRQATLVSATNIKTVNGNSILGSGDLTITAGLTGNGTVTSSVVPLANWSTTNSSLSSTKSYVTEDTTNGKITFNSSVTSSSGTGIGTNITDTIKAAANSDTLTAVSINPTFVNGSYTSVNNFGLRLYNNPLAFGFLNGSGVGSGNSFGKLSFFNGTNSANIVGSYINAVQSGGQTSSLLNFYVAAQNNSAGTLALQLGTNQNTISAANGTVATGGIVINPTISNALQFYQNVGTYALYNIYTPSAGGNLIFKAGNNYPFVITNNGNTLFNTTSDDGVNSVQVNGSAKATSFNSTATQTTLSGGSSGSAIFSQPLQGSSLKKVIVYCNALNGATSTYTFPTAFTNTPAIVSTNGLASSIVTTLTSSTMVVTGSTSTGIIILEGY